MQPHTTYAGPARGGARWPAALAAMGAQLGEHPAILMIEFRNARRRSALWVELEVLVTAPSSDLQAHLARFGEAAARAAGLAYKGIAVRRWPLAGAAEQRGYLLVWVAPPCA